MTSIPKPSHGRWPSQPRHFVQRAGMRSCMPCYLLYSSVLVRDLHWDILFGLRGVGASLFVSGCLRRLQGSRFDARPIIAFLMLRVSVGYIYLPLEKRRKTCPVLALHRTGRPPQVHAPRDSHIEGQKIGLSPRTYPGCSLRT